MDKSEIQNLIKELLEKITIPVSKISTDDNKPSTLNSDTGKTVWFSVEVNQPHFFWDRGGEGLSALNHLVRRIIENKNSSLSLGEGVSPSPREREQVGGLGILIDINGFQKKRVENVHAIAHMMAERARYFKSNIEIEPMPAFERRIVHEFLADNTDLKTESEGEGLSRRVVIKYIGTI